MLAEAGSRGATTVALTGFPRSPLAELADIVLLTASQATTFRPARCPRSTPSWSCSTLYIAVAQRTHERAHAAFRADRAGRRTGTRRAKGAGIDDQRPGVRGAVRPVLDRLLDSEADRACDLAGRPDRRQPARRAACSRRSAPGTPRRSPWRSSPGPAGWCRPTGSRCGTWSCTATRRATCSPTPSWNATRPSPTGSTRSRRPSRGTCSWWRLQLRHQRLGGRAGGAGQGARSPADRGHLGRAQHRVTSRHPSGQRLADLADVVLDNGAPYGDALLPLERRRRGLCGLLGHLGAAGADADRRGRATCSSGGEDAPIYLSANVPGGDEHNTRPREPVRRASPAWSLTDRSQRRRVSSCPNTPHTSTRARAASRAAAGMLPPAAGAPARRLRHPGSDRRTRRVGGPAPPAPTNPLGVDAKKPLEVRDLQRRLRRRSTPPTSTSRCSRRSIPDAAIKHHATKEITKVLQPRFAGGNPPDVHRQLRRERHGHRRAGPGRPAAGPHPAAGRAELGRPGRQGPRHARARRRSSSAPSTASRQRPELRQLQSSASGTRRSCSGQRLDVAEDLGRVPRAAARRSRSRARSRRSPTPGKHPYYSVRADPHAWPRRSAAPRS